jgi:hypothetical protein
MYEWVTSLFSSSPQSLPQTCVENVKEIINVPEVLPHILPHICVPLPLPICTDEELMTMRSKLKPPSTNQKYSFFHLQPDDLKHQRTLLRHTHTNIPITLQQSIVNVLSNLKHVAPREHVCLSNCMCPLLVAAKENLRKSG